MDFKKSQQIVFKNNRFLVLKNDMQVTLWTVAFSNIYN